MASTKKMNLASPSIFQQQFETIRTQLFLPETEESWDAIAHSITAMAASCNDPDSYAPAELVATMRSISRPLIGAMNSERSRLSGVAMDLVAVMASSLGVAFEPLLVHYFPILLALSSRTSKVTVARARACILTIIDATHLPSILPYLLQSVTDKSVSLRLTIVESTLACMNCFNPPDLEKDARAKEIEVIIRTTARDANADVRKVSRKVFEAYKLLLPSRLESFAAPLSPTTRKYLDIQLKTTDKLKQPHAQLPPPPKASELSSSTSVMRGPSSRRPPTHARSASSPAVAPEVGAPGETEGHPPPSRAKGAMGPPRLPEAIQPSRQPVMVRSTSVTERKRVVSMSATVRPAMPIPKPGAAERGRPVPVPSSSASRRQPVVDDVRPKTTSVVARRVPISEVQKPDAEKAIRRIDNSASTPAMRQASVPTPPLAIGSKPPVPRVVRKQDASANRATVKPKAREPTKSSLMQPTLSQLARAKTIERRAPVAAVPKPKTAPRKPVPTTKGDSQAPSVSITPASDEQAIPASTSSLVAGQEPQTINESSKDEDGTSTREDVIPDTRSETPSDDAEDSEKSSEGRINVIATPRDASDLGSATPPREKSIAASKTPISELLLSIERGFLFTPSAPLSPPQSYLALAPPGDLAIPFPLQTLWSTSEQPEEELGEITDKAIEGVRRLDSRRALGDVALNK